MILVMGATGNIGSKITAHLLENNRKVRCVARHFPDKYAFEGAELAEGDANGVSFLTEAMRGCTAVFTMIPPNYSAPQVRYYQNKLGEVIAESIEEARIRKVVNLSSLGADLLRGTGPVLGLHDQEERLNQITHADIIHLRPTYFMENLISGIPKIISFGKYFGTIPEDVPVSMIATTDIAARAAFLLMSPQFVGRSVEHLLGQRDITFGEIVRTLGQAIKKPELVYEEISAKEMKRNLMGAGLPEDWAVSMNELAARISDGTMAARGERTKMNTTATSIEEFARTTFLKAYNQQLFELQKRKIRPEAGSDQNLMGT